MKLWLKALMLATLAFMLGVTAFAEAPEISSGITTVLTGGAEADEVLDGSRKTKLYAEAGEKLLIESEKPFSQIYLIWDGPVAEWTLQAGDAKSSFGTYGFLHEHIALELPQTSISITFSGKATLCDIYFFGEGEAPSWVQKWQPPYDDADMLVLPTHADDEHLWFGGAMPYYAGELGYKVQVAYMTNHWGEPYRPHELLNGLWTVGIRAHPVIGDFVDMYSETVEAAAEQYGEEKVIGWQVELLRRFTPEVVIAHDINGEYGHGAHRLNASSILKAAERASIADEHRESAEKYGCWDTPKLYLHLWPENMLTMDWNIPLKAFGGKTALEMAREGYAQHLSQQQYYFAVEDFGAYDCRKFGLAKSTVGEDISKNDFFENISYEKEEPEESETVPEPLPEQSKPPLIPEEPEKTPEETPENEPARENDGGKIAAIISAGVLALLLVCVALVLVFRRRRVKK